MLDAVYPPSCYVEHYHVFVLQTSWGWRPWASAWWSSRARGRAGTWPWTAADASTDRWGSDTCFQIQTQHRSRYTQKIICLKQWLCSFQRDRFEQTNCPQMATHRWYDIFIFAGSISVLFVDVYYGNVPFHLITFQFHHVESMWINEITRCVIHNMSEETRLKWLNFRKTKHSGRVYVTVSCFICNN